MAFLRKVQQQHHRFLAGNISSHHLSLVPHPISTSTPRANTSTPISRPTLTKGRPFSTSPAAASSSKPPPSSSTTTSSSPSSGPLQGLRILDFTRILAGPFCTQILSDYGASVIKVESPHRGDETRSWQRGEMETSAWKSTTPSSSLSEEGPKDSKDKKKERKTPMSFFFASLNRGKKSLEIDLKSPEGKEIIHRLISSGEIDVVIENFIPGTMQRLGIGYPDLSKLHPGLIFASISGYGSTGPHGKRAGYDAIANAESGMMQITGSAEGGPVRAGVGLTDMATGLFVHGAVLAAVIHRMKTGRGQWISGSLFETSLAMLTSVGAHWLNLGVETPRFGAGHPSVVPYNAWQCADGVWMVVAANSDRQFAIFCEKLGKKEDWTENDERFVSNAKRVENRKVLDDLIAEVFLQKSHEEWLEIFDGSGLAHGPVNTVEKAFDHPQARARDMVQEMSWDALSEGRTWKAIGVPVKFGETPGKIQGPASRLGEHSEEVLLEAGYSKKEIDEMREKGVFGG